MQYDVLALTVIIPKVHVNAAIEIYSVFTFFKAVLLFIPICYRL